MVFNETEDQEREYLQQVIDIIKDTIKNVDVSVKEHVTTLQEYKEYIWTNKDIDPHEIRSMRESILNHVMLGDNVIDKRRRLEKLLDIPYFGRIDFKEKDSGDEVIPVYIGVHTFYDLLNKVNLIYDWRAPISGMFYEHETGEASYLSPAGEIKGDISLKRQYRIRNGRMEYMIESMLTIHDEILQKELSSNATNRMRNIVATIQQEQNRIIRNENAGVLIIQGVAGSGKTSIALHRIAYLLYAFKGKLTSKDILIVSPNRVFSDYISNVLPELGEESIPEISPEHMLSGILKNKYRYQDFFSQVAELSDKLDAELIERIRYKSSFDFISQLDRFILHVENTYFKAEDVILTKYVTVPAEFIQEQFGRFSRYPMRKRMEPMTDYILEVMETRYGVTATTAMRNILKKAIKEMFVGNNDLLLYKDFFVWLCKPEMFKLRKNRMLEYADLAPLAYLHLAMEGNDSPSRVKHLLIDEMQDYSPIQYKIIQKLYNCRKTILGDAGQSVNPYGSSTADMIQKAFVTGEVMKLCKSYRSTWEITAFAQRVIKREELEAVARHGKQPEILIFDTKLQEILGIADLIAGFRNSDYKSLGIICKTETQAGSLAEELGKYVEDIYFLSHQSSTFVKGVVITSTHMAKGLEFDEVIVPLVNAVNYSSEMDRNLLYIAVTRAMHRLSVTC
ncbi:MAG: AAA family ATPase [Candidatus Azobacteroides sp.]|nr:AAA family ATPase [Candidatus Azobacteroides sp.]